MQLLFPHKSAYTSPERLVMQRARDEAFGKKMGLKPIEKTPYYTCKTVPATCDTAGGLRINTKAEVLDVQGEVISGLYATGSTTGGWRGKWYPSSDTVVSFTVTIGRIAGLSAAALDPCKQWSKHVT